MRLNPAGILRLTLLVAASLLFSSFHVRGEEAAPLLQVASSAVDTPRQRIVLPAMKAGGIRPGQTMLIAERGAEFMNASKLVQLQPLALKLNKDPTCVAH